MIIVLLVLISAVLSIGLFYSIRSNLRYVEQLDQIRDQVEKSLDVLNTCYQRVAEKSNIELLSDEPIVRDLVYDMKRSKDAILLVANMIVTPFNEDEEDDEEETE